MDNPNPADVKLIGEGFGFVLPLKFVDIMGGNANNKYAVEKFWSLCLAAGASLFWGTCMLEINAGCLYFVDDAFFEKVNDPYLKINYDSPSRPHYMAFFDTVTSLYWLV